MRKSWLLGSVLLLVLVACGDPKPPVDSPTAGTGSGPTVYDDANSSGGGGGVDDAEVIEDDMSVIDVAVTDEDGDYGSEQLDTNVQQRPSAADLNWGPVYFEFDKAVLNDDAKTKLADYANRLQRFPDLRVLIEGHCDERGTEEYNIALGERRAQQVKRYLMELGVNASQLKTISYGELRPQILGDSESAWAQNRRVAFTF